MAKSQKTRVKHSPVKKLTPSDLSKVTGGYGDTRDCKSPDQPTCLAYIIVKDPSGG
jgi:hypothetical protein